jgi:hypothetical protein
MNKKIWYINVRIPNSRNSEVIAHIKASKRWLKFIGKV